MSDLIFAPTNSLIHQSFNGGFHPGAPPKRDLCAPTRIHHCLCFQASPTRTTCRTALPARHSYATRISSLASVVPASASAQPSPHRILPNAPRPHSHRQQLNADGFGVGWYHKRGGAIFRSVTAAWNNSNLRELSESIESRCIFAHVRAASGSVISEVNCHPFRYGVQAWRCRADAAVNRVSSPLLLSQAVCSSSTTDTSRALTASSGECSLRCAMTSATCCKRLGFWRLSVHLA